MLHYVSFKTYLLLQISHIQKTFLREKITKKKIDLHLFEWYFAGAAAIGTVLL